MGRMGRNGRPRRVAPTGVVINVLADVCQCFCGPNFMVVIITLPQTAVEGRPFGLSNPANVSVRRHRFEPANDVAKVWPGWSYGRRCMVAQMQIAVVNVVVCHMSQGFRRPAFAAIIHDEDQEVNVIRHAHYDITLYAWKLPFQLEVPFQHHLACIIQ